MTISQIKKYAESYMIKLKTQFNKSDIEKFIKDEELRLNNSIEFHSKCYREISRYIDSVEPHIESKKRSDLIAEMWCPHNDAYKYYLERLNNLRGKWWN